MKHLCAILCITILMMTSASLAADDDGFVSLIDGKTLNGWEQKGGKATYRVEDGAIVGETVPNTPNSFLCTKKHYGDFILEYEFKCHAELNSGVQIRSTVYDKTTEVEVNGKKRKFPAGRVHGYQVEIDANKPNRMWVGGIYDESRRGWLYRWAVEGRVAYSRLGDGERAPMRFLKEDLEEFARGQRIPTLEEAKGRL